ncbi:MAG TPA: hypothetical protein VNY84_09985, partial [Acidimicrobiales bacterium]|nr:hypothetical protein [Acidimicrobiales bacterium]
MRRFATLALVLAVLTAIFTPLAAHPASLPSIASLTGGCDPIDPARCLLPFPDDFFTVSDPAQATGRRVNFPLAGMPQNVAGIPVDPTEWNRNDGFSPGTPLLTMVAGLDLNRTWGMSRPEVTNIARSLQVDSPIAVIDAGTGQRQPVWAELDGRAGVPADERLLIVRPAVNFAEGHHYVVALRDLRHADGTFIPPGPAFAAFRDRRAAPGSRASALERDFAVLARAGIGRKDLYLTWDFTIASGRNLAGRALSIRNQAFALLGDTNLADGKITGQAPDFTITSVTNFTAAQDKATGRRVEGTVTVPNFLTPQVSVTVTTPSADIPASLPASRLNYAGSTDGFPRRDPVQPDLHVPFVCDIPHAAFANPSHPLLYGHGLLGDKSEATGGSTFQLRLRNFTTCAVDWIGFASEDLANVATVLVDLSNFPSVVDRAQQGFLNFMLLGRALAHPKSLVESAAFRGPDGRPLIRTGQLYYDGNSQGGIMGGALTALDPDFTTAVLGVTAMNYSTLLDRSVDWVDSYFKYYALAYPDPLDQELGYGLLQMLWDRAEADGYAQHMTSMPLPGTPAHHVLMNVALGDHQVSNFAAEVEGRTIGAKLRVPALATGQHWSVDPAFGFQTVVGS